jgi:hypothetical protein
LGRRGAHFEKIRLAAGWHACRKPTWRLMLAEGLTRLRAATPAASAKAESARPRVTLGFARRLALVPNPSRVTHLHPAPFCRRRPRNVARVAHLYPAGAKWVSGTRFFEESPPDHLQMGHVCHICSWMPRCRRRGQRPCGLRGPIASTRPAAAAATPWAGSWRWRAARVLVSDASPWVTAFDASQLGGRGPAGPCLPSAANRKWPGCRWVFHYIGRRLGGHLKGWGKACESAGMGALPFHDLRRSAVRNMERAGIPRNVAMKHQRG